MNIPPGLVCPLINVLYRLWCSSLRVVQTGREAPDRLDAEGRLQMFCLFHDELFTLMRVRRGLRVATVVSRSRDGEYLARLLHSLGLKTARGSSSRGGLSALKGMERLMREDRRHGVITVDGPVGPRHIVKQGAVVLAFRVPALLVPVRLFPRRAVVFNSWDRFQLPLPFSRVDIVFGTPYAASLAELDPSEVERERAELQKRLNELRVADVDRPETEPASLQAG
ncbi:MAG: lysophospholipid acyltransferase family protein [Desulfovibrio sp.]|nr:lysophospholipid acyltransferase family protein [Desulfovibrio sp.]